MSTPALPARRPGVASFLKWLRRTKPFPYSQEIAGTAMALLYLVGGLSMLLAQLLPHPATLNDPLLITLGVVLTGLGVVIYQLRHRIRQSFYPWMLALGTVVITLITAVSGSTSAAMSFSFFYLWVVIYALLFLNPAVAALEIALAAVGYLWATIFVAAQTGDPLTAFEPVSFLTVILTTGWIIMWLSQAREHSEIDPLTLVMNRRGLDRVLHDALRCENLSDQPLVAGLIDVDHFKTVNDHRGHAAGDQLLEDLTRGWQGVLRSGDTLGRIGGDEFVVVLPDCSPTEANRILERLRTAALHLDVTCSVGAALSSPADSASLLLGRADTALYRAKNDGRNRVAWAH